ncbi:MAG: response regulator transcription factor [Sulfuritalea sp.]|jgi:DNA-binding NarL/FixJ family response regulator|nr:response regulator transcription factor [Sulfuritalea sp.]
MIRVLLADDHAIIRDGVKQILADTDDLVVTGEAANGDEALKIVAKHDFDLLVLDISMPGKSGLELIKLVRQVKPRLPMLVFSMHNEEQYALRALRAGASGYITKESDGEVLATAMRKVAAGGVYVSNNVAELLARERMQKTDELPHTRLSDREFQIFEKIIAGIRLTDIATEFNLSIKTISTHKSRILQKMNLASDTDLVRYAIAKGLMAMPE